jgi:putative SOS response-associated peptidase YedK
MCNLYSITRGQEAIRRLFRVTRDLAGNLPALPAVYPDTMAPVVRVARDGERELTMMRWGFPPPPNRERAPVTNVRNVKSPYWRMWLKTEWRCLVPATSFCEWSGSRPKVPYWFALDESRPLFAHELFSFLTTEANEVVRPIHAMAMPVLLTATGDWNTWLSGPVPEAAALQRPLPDEMLRVVAAGDKTDGNLPA